MIICDRFRYALNLCLVVSNSVGKYLDSAFVKQKNGFEIVFSEYFFVVFHVIYYGAKSTMTKRVYVNMKRTVYIVVD